MSICKPGIFGYPDDLMTIVVNLRIIKKKTRVVMIGDLG